MPKWKIAFQVHVEARDGDDRSDRAHDHCLGLRLEDSDITIAISQAAKDRLIEIGFDPTLGARPLRRAVQREIEDKLSEKIMHGELKNSSHIDVDFVNGEFVFASRLHSSAEPLAALQ